MKKCVKENVYKLCHWLNNIKALIPHSAFYFILGLCLMAVASIIHHNIQDPLHQVRTNQIYADVVKEVAISFFIFACLLLTIEFANFTNYVLKKLTDVMIKDEFLENLSPARLKDLATALEKRLYYADQSIESDHFFSPCGLI